MNLHIPFSAIRSDAPGRRSFTLIELLAAISVLAMILVMLFAVFDQASKSWVSAERRVDCYQTARAIMDLIARDLSQAVTTTNLAFCGGPTGVLFPAPIDTDSANWSDLDLVGYALDDLESNAVVRILNRPTDTIVHGVNWWDNNPIWCKPCVPPLHKITDCALDATGYLGVNMVTNLTFQYCTTNGCSDTYFSNDPGNECRPPFWVLIRLDVVDPRSMALWKGPPNVRPTVVRQFSMWVRIPSRQY